MSTNNDLCILTTVSNGHGVIKVVKSQGLDTLFRFAKERGDEDVQNQLEIVKNSSDEPSIDVPSHAIAHTLPKKS